MVFAGVYPIETEDFENLRASLEKLQLNDASLTFQPESSAALGFGFRCGFLGLLHMEIIQERLDREFNMDVITTVPNVSYKVYDKKGAMVEVHNPSGSYVDRSHRRTLYTGIGHYFDRLHRTYYDFVSGEAWRAGQAGIYIGE